MTREEAIKELRESHDMMRSYTIDESESRLMTALKMAISALEQEPCEDAISREHLLSEIEKLKQSPWYNDKRGNGFEYLIKEAVDTVVDLCIKQEPSVQPKPIECEDAISLEAVIEWLKEKDFIKMSWQEDNARKELQEYFSVTPSHKGHWETFEVYQGGIKETWYECSKCKWNSALLIPRKYCPNCGAEMESAE